MKQLKSSALFITASLLFNGISHGSHRSFERCGHREEQFRAATGVYPKITAAEQVMAMGMMKYIQKKMSAVPVKLDTRGNIPQSCILRMNDVGKCSIYYQNKGFLSETERGLCPVPQENVDDVLGRLDDKTMGQYLALGKIGVSKGSDGALMLRSCIGSRGGGPALAYYGAYAFDGLWAYAQWKISSRALNKIPDIAEGLAEGAKQLKEHVSKFVGEMTNEDRYRGIGSVKDIAHNLWLGDKAQYDFLMSHGLKDSANNLMAKIQDMRRYREIAADIVKDQIKANTKSYVAEKLKNLPKTIKDGIEKSIGGNIFSDKIQDVATGAFKSGAFGAFVSVGFQLGSNIISNMNGPVGGTAKIIGGTIGAVSEPVWGDWLDRLLEPSGIAAVAMSGFWYGGLRYTAKTLFVMGLAALPGA